jgi:hypothetical protein
VVRLQGGGVVPHGHVLLLQQGGQARQHLHHNRVNVVRGVQLRGQEPGLLQSEYINPTEARAGRRGQLTQRRAEPVSQLACWDMTSIRALDVSEYLETSTGVGTLGTR